MEAIKAFVNTWLKDNTFYCGNCGEELMPHFHKYEPCCENMQMGRNKDHVFGIIKQNKETMAKQNNEFGSNEEKSFRFGASLPPKLLQDLEIYFKGYGEKLFNNNKEFRAFLKEFPAFKVCQKI